ncbi:MAG: hypothetical protein ACFE9Q_07535 [Candidatus Hodarchaeota archaeon]
MTSKKYLSNKRTTQQTISTSPAIKDWVKRYVNVKHTKNPNDERYKSISSFYNYIMENVLKFFEEGKTIDDLKRVEDKKIKEFFDRFTFKATIPLYEMAIEPNKYTHFTFEFNTRFLLMYLDFFRSEVKPHNFNDIKLFFEKIRTRYATTNISKDMKLQLFPVKNKRSTKGTLEFIGKYKNLHFENCKFFAAVFGILGARVTDFIYSPADYYCRLDLLETDLLFKKELAKKERLKLIKENVDFMVNYNRILDDNDKYLWMNLGEDNELFISFKTKIAFNKWIKTIERDLGKFGTQEDFLSKILQFFNKLHWIRIENIKNLSFRIDQAIEKSTEQKQMLIDYLSEHSVITQNNGIYYLK